jgi:hypothetical protein
MSCKLKRAGRILPALSLILALSLAGCHELLHPQQQKEEPWSSCEAICEDSLDVVVQSVLPQRIRVRVDGDEVLDECLVHLVQSGRRTGDSQFTLLPREKPVREGDRLRIQVEARGDCSSTPVEIFDEEVVVPALESFSECDSTCKRGRLALGSP